MPVVKEEEVYSYAKRVGKPVVVLLGHSGIGDAMSSAVHKVLNPPEGTEKVDYLASVLQKVILATEGKLEGFGELPKIGLSLKRTYVGDLTKETEIHYHFPEEGKVIEEFAKMRREDPALEMAINYCKKYCRDINKGVLLVKGEPRTRTVAAVKYILHSLALAVARAAGIGAPYVKNYHGRHLESARRKLFEPPRG